MPAPHDRIVSKRTHPRHEEEQALRTTVSQMARGGGDAARDHATREVLLAIHHRLGEVLDRLDGIDGP